jgi:hypothetical protein
VTWAQRRIGGRYLYKVAISIRWYGASKLDDFLRRLGHRSVGNQQIKEDGEIIPWMVPWFAIQNLPSWVPTALIALRWSNQPAHGTTDSLPLQLAPVEKWLNGADLDKPNRGEIFTRRATRVGVEWHMRGPVW